MRLGVIFAQSSGEADGLLSTLVGRLETKGISVAGTVQSSAEAATGHACDMDVQIIGGGPAIRVNQNLGTGSKSCRLDLSALERVVGEVSAQISDTTDLVIINKFGKHEAEGRGFSSLIADSLSKGLPVLTAVNQLNRPGFEAFAGDLADALPADLAALETWVDSVVEAKRTSAVA